MISEEEKGSKAIRLSFREDGKEVGRASLFLITNDLHDMPYGLLEDVFVDSEYRGKGIASSLVRRVLEIAREKGCYKIIATSRHARKQVHSIYEHLGFSNHGLEFRRDLRYD